MNHNEINFYGYPEDIERISLPRNFGVEFYGIRVDRYFCGSHS